MKTTIRKVYSCDHCGKNYFLKPWCEKHEPKCSKNPINDRLCFGCDNLTKKIIPLYIDQPDGSESKRMVEVFFCEKIDSALYPPNTNDPFEFGDPINEEMKTECDEFRSFREFSGFFSIPKPKK